MMLHRASLFVLLFTLVSLAMPLTAYAGIPFFGPIIPSAYSTCPAGWGMLITVINNIIQLLITLAIVFVAPLMIAYSGFLFVVNPVNSGGIQQAKGILTNTIVGIVIALAGWMIVNALMAVLYNPTAVGKTWFSLINSGNLGACLKQEGASYQPGVIRPAVTTTARRTPPPGRAGTACDPAVVKAAAARGGYTLTDTQANTFACIAAPESNCGAPHNPPNYNWDARVSSPGSSAAGAFQVLLSTHANCYEKSVCYAAAGVSGPLNCRAGFVSGGKVSTTPTGAAIVQKCVQAANNLDCSTTAAACLLQQSGGSFRDWQADVNSARQTGCITGS